jgi:hypothetical protein
MVSCGGASSVGDSGTVTSPAVILSPKARNLVASSVGRRATSMTVWQLSLCPRASVPWQVTMVVPTANAEPEGGAQLVAIGG